MLFLSTTLTSSGFVPKEVIFVDSSEVVCSIVSLKSAAIVMKLLPSSTTFFASL